MLMRHGLLAATVLLGPTGLLDPGDVGTTAVAATLSDKRAITHSGSRSSGKTEAAAISASLDRAV